MISRVAENCFWMSRYLERAENTARILDVNRTLLLDLEVPFEQQWRPVLIISGIHDWPGEHSASAVQEYMAWDLDNPWSILSSMKAARENARIIRDVISIDMWERLNYYYHWLQSPEARALYASHRSDFYAQVKRVAQLIHGISDGTMSHGEAWEFFQLGKHLERACQTARILDVKYHTLLPTPEQVGTPVDNAHWVAILTSCSGYEPYHRRQLGTVDPSIGVADFLILDAQFPRSVQFCLRECREASRAISGLAPEQPGDEVEQRLDSLLDWLQLTTIHEIVHSGLHEVLTSVVNSIHDIGSAIDRTYFDMEAQALLADPQPLDPQVCGSTLE